MLTLVIKCFIDKNIIKMDDERFISRHVIMLK
ncbi:hypothetical protein J2X19_005143 [Rhodoferax ferrireducens]|uniref:Uncharacterized protein n=1 Tax=Rhodoferax ferrireducens TaxID=192843 RepID=A0ABU2CGL1_9BURK|nr:hypothetical protein [Rhodoferax ferrireducens]